MKMEGGDRRRKLLTVLLVEDNPDHAELTLRALKDAGPASDTVWVKDGEEALEYVGRRGRYQAPGLARPALILLDINLPKVSGHEVLRRIKGNPESQPIPIVMLTTSGREDEVRGTYRAGANSYVTKPIRFSELVETMRALKVYWLTTCVLPES
jgi:two-component system response regulator